MESGRDIKTFCLVNTFKTNLVLILEIQGPFKIISSYTNSSLKHPLPPQNISKTAQTAFNLAENSNIEIQLKFDSPNIKDYSQWPLTYKAYKNGKLIINFSNGDSQEIFLEAIMLRPHISMSMIGIEGKHSPDTYDFGVIHINNSKIADFYLCNSTIVPAKWKLMNVKFPIKSQPGFATKTKLELEDEIKIDDIGVFEFSISDVLFFLNLYKTIYF